METFRTIAILAVIAIHTKPFEQPLSHVGETFDLATFVNQSARFAVPLFFVLSGYFWARKIGQAAGPWGPTARSMKRMAFLFCAWCLVYLLPMNLWDVLQPGGVGAPRHAYWSLASAVDRPLEGTKSHLWFLPALLCAAGISTVLLHFGRERVLVALALVLYLVGLAGKAYSLTPLGFATDFDMKDGPFFSLIFFVTGYLLHKRTPHGGGLRWGLALAALGLLLQLVEVFVLHRTWGTQMDQDFVVGTYFFGTGVAVMALSNASLFSGSRLSAIGPSVLGIYLVHFIFVDLLIPVDRRLADSPVWDVAYVLCVFVLSYALVAWLGRFAATRRLVR